MSKETASALPPLKPWPRAPLVGWGRLDNFPGMPLYDGKDIYLAKPGDTKGLSNRLITVFDDLDKAREVGLRGKQIIKSTSPFNRSPISTCPAWRTWSPTGLP
ncbi:MAG: hypothetical protein R2709_03980 [Marmoricola sp.]